MVSSILSVPTSCSILNDYFNITIFDNRLKSGNCKICSCQINIKDESYGNFINHLRNKHFSHFTEYSNKQHSKKRKLFSSNYKNSSNNNNSQSLIQFPTIDKNSTEIFLDSLAYFMAASGLPHLMIQNPSFKQMLANFALCVKQGNSNVNNIIPSQRSSIRKRILSLGNDVFSKIIESLSNKPQLFVTLAVDGWTGHAFGGKNTNIIAIAQKQAYLLWSDRNEDADDSATDYLVPLMTEKIKFLIQREVAVVAFITDNAANMRKSGVELYQNELFGRVVLRISCSAHTISD